MTIDVGVKGGIITGGLGRPACQGMITMFPFSLYCAVVPAPLRGGGSIPLAPGEIQNFYQPVDPSLGTKPVEGNFVDPSVYGKKIVRIVLKFNGHTYESEYLVSEKRAKTVVKIINLVNATKARVRVMASNLHRVTTNALVKIKNLRVKYFGNK